MRAKRQRVLQRRGFLAYLFGFFTDRDHVVRLRRPALFGAIFDALEQVHVVYCRHRPVTVSPAKRRSPFHLLSRLVGGIQQNAPGLAENTFIDSSLKELLPATSARGNTFAEEPGVQVLLERVAILDGPEQLHVFRRRHRPVLMGALGIILMGHTLLLFL